MMDVAVSVGGVPIRLTHERWFHIVENHDDVAGYYDEVLETIENPDLVVRGYRGTLIAVRSDGRRRYFMVVYRQVSADDRQKVDPGVSPTPALRLLLPKVICHIQRMGR